MQSPSTGAQQNTDANHIAASEHAHQQIVINGDKAWRFIVALSLIVNILCIFTIAFGAFIYYQAKALDQNRYDWLQRDWVMPQQGKLDEHDKEIQAIMNRLQEKR